MKWFMSELAAQKTIQQTKETCLKHSSRFLFIQANKLHLESSTFHASFSNTANDK
jgi:hypothetical protein